MSLTGVDGLPLTLPSLSTVGGRSHPRRPVLLPNPSLPSPLVRLLGHLRGDRRQWEPHCEPLSIRAEPHEVTLALNVGVASALLVDRVIHPNADDLVSLRGPLGDCQDHAPPRRLDRREPAERPELAPLPRRQLLTDPRDGPRTCWRRSEDRADPSRP